jgi:hypothetical protein
MTKKKYNYDEIRVINCGPMKSELMNVAKHNGTNMTTLVRQAIRAFLDKQPETIRKG